MASVLLSCSASSADPFADVSSIIRRASSFKSSLSSAPSSARSSMEARTTSTSTSSREERGSPLSTTSCSTPESSRSTRSTRSRTATSARSCTTPPFVTLLLSLAHFSKTSEADLCTFTYEGIYAVAVRRNGRVRGHRQAADQEARVAVYHVLRPRSRGAQAHRLPDP